MNKDIALYALEEVRAQLLDIVNGRIDALIIKVKNGEPLNNNGSADIETVYPLSISPAFFKGTKPTAIYFGDEKVAVKTWRKAYTLVLQRCAGIPEMREALMGLRNKISGRKRTVLSDMPDGMDFPIEIADGIFAEADFDTEWLIKTLTNVIFDFVRYDYSDISVSVVKNKRGGSRYL